MYGMQSIYLAFYQKCLLTPGLHIHQSYTCKLVPKNGLTSAACSSPSQTIHFSLANFSCFKALLLRTNLCETVPNNLASVFLSTL